MASSFAYLADMLLKSPLIIDLILDPLNLLNIKITNDITIIIHHLLYNLWPEYS